MFFKVISGVLGCLVNFNITSIFLLGRPVFPDYLSVSCDWIKQSYMKYFNGRKRHFPWWYSRVLGWTNVDKVFHDTGAIHLVLADLSILPTSHLMLTCTHLEYPRLLGMWPQQFDTPSTFLTLLVCHSFLILVYLKNSEIYDLPEVAYKMHFLASHLVPSSLPRKVYSLTMASNC